MRTKKPHKPENVILQHGGDILSRHSILKEQNHKDKYKEEELFTTIWHKTRVPDSHSLSPSADPDPDHLLNQGRTQAFHEKKKKFSWKIK